MKRSALLSALCILMLGAESACGPVESTAREGSVSAVSASTENTGEREERQADGSEPATAAGPGVVSLDDFARSPFCRAYRCSVDKSWDLQEGGVNHTFRIPGNDGILIEAEVDSGQVVNAGLFLLDWPKDASGTTGLPADDLSLVDAFVRSFAGGECAAAERLVRANATRAYESTEQAPSTRCGAWTVRAALLMSPLITLKRSE